MRGIPPVTGDLRQWAQALSRALQGGYKLPFRTAASSAAEDGILAWDASAGEVVVSDAGAWVSLGGGGGGVSDGDKGDITVTGGGATWTIDDQAVTAAKFQNIATARIVGRVAAGAGSVAALTAAEVRTLLNVADGATAYAPVSGLATITVPNNSREWTQTVTATGVTPSSRIMLTIGAHDDADQNSAETLDIMGIMATPGTGQITIDIGFGTPAAGPIKINWSAV